MLKEKLKTVPAAVAVLAAVMVVFTLLGVRLSLDRLSGDVEDAFYEGAYDDGSSYVSVALSDLLNNRVNYSTGLVTVAYNYGIDTGDLLSARNDLIDALDGRDISAAFNANTRLESAWTHVYAALEGADMTERDAENARAYAEDLSGAQSAVSVNPYNEKVEEFYTRTLSAFPVGVLRHAVFFTGGPEYFA